MLFLRCAKRTCFRFKIEWRIGSRYAAVFPDPVFALARTSRPFNASGIALLCTRVGVLKFCFAMPWSNRGSSPRLAKVDSSPFPAISSAGAGTSLTSNLRFIFVLVENARQELRGWRSAKLFLQHDLIAWSDKASRDATFKAFLDDGSRTKASLYRCPHLSFVYDECSVSQLVDKAYFGHLLLKFSTSSILEQGDKSLLRPSTFLSYALELGAES